MSGIIHPLWMQARRRAAAVALLQALPWALTAVAVAALWWGHHAGAVTGLLAAIASAAWAWRAWQRHDAAWWVHTLNVDPAMQDSADLLLIEPATLNPLQQRQRTHVQAMLAQRRTPLPVHAQWRWQAVSWAICGVLLAANIGAAAWLSSSGPTDKRARPGSSTTSVPTRAAVPALRASTLSITAPAYTGQPARQQPELDAKAPQGSQLHWSLRFSPQPDSVTLRFHDGRELPLQRDGETWSATLTLERSALYRVATEPALADTPLHRLDAIADTPPQIEVLAPEQTLTLGSARQRQWALQFRVTDDYGVATQAQLRVTVAQGSGENITFREQQFTLAGNGPARDKRFSRTLDLAALEAGAGDDVIAQLSVHDNRTPAAQLGRSASLILRLPSEAEQQSSDLEGAIKKVMPAYFRSQRQIIIDAEALLKQRNTLEAEAFAKRSDAIGVDQRILRLRYGQFLGEEAEGGITPPAAGDLPTSDAPSTAKDDHSHDDGHGHDDAAATETAPVFGSATDVLSEYGHTHDHAEAATLLDPKTRATLKAALDQMWSAEGELRLGKPDKALPFAYKALGLIKQVQQAERIYLARLGPELPPIDATRRMSGKREGIASRRIALAAPIAGDDRALQVWQQLGDEHGAADLDALAAWLRQHEAELSDPLSLAAAMEELRAAPDCTACRQRLRTVLWGALRRPPAQVQPRALPDATGQRYLDALKEHP